MPYLLGRVDATVNAIAGLVDGVDDGDGIQLGNFLQVLLRDDPVEVNRFQSLDRSAHAVKAECADAGQAAQQNAGHQQEVGFDFPLFHYAFLAGVTSGGLVMESAKISGGGVGHF